MEPVLVSFGTDLGSIQLNTVCFRFGTDVGSVRFEPVVLVPNSVFALALDTKVDRTNLRIPYGEVRPEPIRSSLGRVDIRPAHH